jgi:arsenite/tail-anchored protein-transporting ATPase
MLRNLAGRDDREPDPVVERLRTQADRLATLRRRLREDAVVHLVLLAERLPIEETARALQALGEGGMHIGALVVNRVLPADADGAYVAARRAQQDDYLAEIDRRFARRQRVRVPQLERDVTDPATLARVAEPLDRLLHAH